MNRAPSPEALDASGTSGPPGPPPVPRPPRPAGSPGPPGPSGPARTRTAAWLRSARGRAVGFGVIGLSGFLPNLGVLWLLTAPAGMHAAPAVVLANQAGILWNFLLTDRLLYGGAPAVPRRPAGLRLVSYAGVNNADLLARVPLTAWLVSGLGWPAVPVTGALLLAFAAARFLLVDRLLYRAHRPRSRRPAPHRTDSEPTRPEEPRS
ncbi:MAG TPA: GtrA family protein [Streptomyces sp.]|uniref:GtrA family protein n=1 Tax=Streptomyces sp. TaxID=1931 RepID=UPI002D3F6DBD|nr:GtrA family protein [Streptomyces sp.]HZG04853.1 GtrA family protein [Streptomyces sp.]